MTVTIKDVMPQGIETMVEREVQNNIDNNGNVGIEMVDAAGEAGGMAVQSSNRRRREKERKRKYHARKADPGEAESVRIASQQRRMRAEWDQCGNIHSWISTIGDYASSHQQEFTVLNSQQGFWRSLPEISLFSLFSLFYSTKAS
jgi:hypothetical protein